MLVVSSDRGLCGAYNSSVFRRAEELFSLLRRDGKTPVLYTVGRKALGYYKFRNWDIVESWTGFSERPSYEDAAKIAETLVTAFMAGAEGEQDGPAGVDELHIVYTEFKSMMSQSAEAHRIAPMVVEYVEDPARSRCTHSSRMRRRCSSRVAPYLDHPRVCGAARVRGIRAGIAPTGNEVGERQRRRSHQGPDSRGQP